MTTTHRVNSCSCFMCVIMPVYSPTQASSTRTRQPMSEHSRPSAAILESPPDDRKSRILQRFWERYFAFYDTLNESAPYRRMVERHQTLLRPAAGDTILDAGAGTGNVTQVLAVPGARVIGIDFCAPALERCRRKVPTAEFRAGDLTRPLAFET